jgi:hypothetical protein
MAVKTNSSSGMVTLFDSRNTAPSVPPLRETRDPFGG